MSSLFFTPVESRLDLATSSFTHARGSKFVPPPPTLLVSLVSAPFVCVIRRRNVKEGGGKGRGREEYEGKKRDIAGKQKMHKV